MTKVKYKFKRDDFSLIQIFPNRASTDAINALNQWESENENWSYSIEEDDDEYLIAELTIQDADLELPGTRLESLCLNRGVIRSTSLT